MVQNFVLHFRPVRVPVKTLAYTHTFGLGGMSLVLLVVLIGTGVLLMFGYEPAPGRAYESVRTLETATTFGGFVRGIHHWSANALILVAVLHLLRVFFTSAFHAPRQFNWVLGLGLLACIAASNFTGYLLPWDQTAYWATVVGINLNGTAPFAGPWLAQFLAGGPEIGSDALAKWYALHMLVLPGAIIGLIGVHIYLVTRLGVSSPPWSSEEAGRERPPVQTTGTRSGLVRGGGGGD